MQHCDIHCFGNSKLKNGADLQEVQTTFMSLCSVDTSIVSTFKIELIIFFPYVSFFRRNNTVRDCKSPRYLQNLEELRQARLDLRIHREVEKCQFLSLQMKQVFLQKRADFFQCFLTFVCAILAIFLIALPCIDLFGRVFLRLL